jgi:hypothetical protein
MTAEIVLTQHRIALVDDEDFEQLRWLRWYTAKIGKRVYAYRNIKIGERHVILPMHREIMGLEYGDHSLEVDHINGDGLDNRRANLRLVTRQQNMANRRGWSQAGYKGVSRMESGKYVAHIVVNGNHHNLGRYDTAEEAARAYNAAAADAFGEFALLNEVADG